MDAKPRVWFERAILPELVDEVGRLCEILGSGTGAEQGANDLPCAAGVVAGALVYDREFMERAPHLQVIARTGIGVDKVDLTAATNLGIAVCNAPDAPTASTAEHTVALMLTVAKNLKQAEGRLERGESHLYARHDALELDGKALGLVGYGRIARRVARVASALGMTVYTFDPYLDGHHDAGAVVVDTLDRLLTVSDVVSLHAPLTDSTRHMMGAEQFAAMKSGAILVNTARGGLVDHQALLAALDSGHLFGVGLDVTDPEPLPSGHPLLGRDDSVVTPHVATGSRAGRRRLFQTAFHQVLQALSGEKPANLVNAEVWE